MTKQDTIEASATELVEERATDLPVAARAHQLPVTTPMEMIGQAVAAGAGVETLNGLMDLQERWEDRQAKKAYNAAIAAARAEIGPITKNRRVAFESKNGGTKTNYAFEDLAQIAKEVDPVLAAHGLSYRWRAEQNGNIVRVTCVVSHGAGYSEETSLEANNDTSGNKNAIQGVGSTVTFLQRYTLKAALGLAVSNDDDGHASGQMAPQCVDIKQLARLRALIKETATKEADFLKHAKAESLEEVLAAMFPRLEQMLITKSKKMGAK